MAKVKPKAEEAVLIILPAQFDQSMTPLQARKLLRQKNYTFENLKGASYGELYKERTLVIPEGGALLMIGSKSELKDAVCRVRDDPNVGFQFIVSDSPLRVDYARIDVSPIQTDTLLAITSGDGLGRNGGWRDVPVKFPSGNFLNMQDAPDNDKTGKSQYILNVIAYCNARKGWISP